MSSSSIEKSLSSCSLEENKSNVIVWDCSSSTGHVQSPKGNIWSCMGNIKNDKAFVHSDEACYLIDSCGYTMELESSKLSCNSSCDDIAILSILFKDCGITSYKIYSHLRKLGYILLRPEFPFYTKIRLFDSLRAEYSLFKPNSKFKKTVPSGCLGYLLEIKNSDTLRGIADKIEQTPERSCFLCISDGSSELCFLESRIIRPNPSTDGGLLNNIRSKQPKSRKPTDK